MSVRLLLVFLFFAGCQLASVPGDQTKPQRDIQAVLRDHDQELLALPNVVGVSVGLVDQRSKKLCLRVMLNRDSAAARRALPKTIEGYAVIPEVTGNIEPLHNRRVRPD